MAPPKRTTSGGRVTPKGTKPGQLPKAAAQHHLADDDRPTKNAAGVEASTRYTPPKPKYADESPPWFPFLVFGLLALGGLAIMSRYLIFDSGNTPVLVGLGFMLAGLYAATKWK